MAHPNLVDMLSASAPREPKMAKKNWIRKAVPKERRGVFKAKAEAAGKTTKEFAAEKSDAPGALGKEARLAENLMGMSHKKSAKAKLYGKG
jgi:hypothetical protein